MVCITLYLGMDIPLVYVRLIRMLPGMTCRAVPICWVQNLTTTCTDSMYGASTAMISLTALVVTISCRAATVTIRSTVMPALIHCMVARAQIPLFTITGLTRSKRSMVYMASM